MAKYTAVRMGYWKGTRIRIGESFEGPDDMKSKSKDPWFVPAEKYKPVEPKPAGGPTTISQIARKQAASPIQAKAPKEDANLNVI